MIGVDEAGRGPVIGPLVVCALKIDDEKILKDLGVRDSKRLSPKKRAELCAVLEDIASISLAGVRADQIDSCRKHTTLNEIEVRLFYKALRGLDKKSERIIVDSCDVNTERFAGRLSSLLNNENVEAYHKADDIYPVVSAASIVAKVHRDRTIADINEKAKIEVGFPVGSGYPSDPVTRKFLEKIRDMGGSYPPYVRTSWKTVKDMSQSSLDSYNK